MAGIFKYLLGAGTGAGVYAGYQTVEQASSLKTGLEDSVGAAATGTASAIGGLLGSVKAGFSSASSQPASPQPVVTHVYHDSRGGAAGTTGTTVFIVGSIALVSYGGVCWYFNLDFFGLSRQRTENLIHALNGKVKDYSQKVQTEIDRLRGKIDDSAVEQARQADVLSQVNQTVQKSGADLEHIGLQNADLAHALGEARATSDSMAQGMLAIQYFLVQVAKGSVTSREDALRMLEASMHEQSAVLMAGQAHAQGQIAPPQGGLPGGGGLLSAAPPGHHANMLPITAPGPAGPGRQPAPGAPAGPASAPAFSGGRADSSARAESSGRADAENAAPEGSWAATIWKPVKAVGGWLSTTRGSSGAGAQQPASYAPFPNGATPTSSAAPPQQTPKVPTFAHAHAAQHPHAGQHPRAARHSHEGSPFMPYQAGQPLQQARQPQHAGQQYVQQPGQLPSEGGRQQYGAATHAYQDQSSYQDQSAYQGQAPPYAATHAYAQVPVDGYPAPPAPPPPPTQSYTPDGFPSSPRHAPPHFPSATSGSTYTQQQPQQMQQQHSQQVSNPMYAQGPQYVQPELLTAQSTQQSGNVGSSGSKQQLSTQASAQQFSGQNSAPPRAMSRSVRQAGSAAAYGGVTIEEVNSSPRYYQNPTIKHPSFF